ncbi:hypothetical protein FOA52_007964 [Chlamydomonas sp. UWO 241]|nr:hypothetical protein FOA52_007964 [Chlamydomonas sp. UWO 241]
MNRSMEAHTILKKNNFNVSSSGVGSHVKLPGPSQKEPNSYKFGTPYKEIFDDLARKDSELYTRNGLLRMVQRNIEVKRAPERFQDNHEPFDVIVTFEERVMDQVIDELNRRPSTLMRPALVVNLDVKDSHEEAALAAPHALRLCSLIDAAELWEDEIEAIVKKLQLETGRKAIYTICFY